MSLYGEVSFMAEAAKGGYGYAGMRNPALEAWAYTQDQELIAAGRARLAQEAAEAPETADKAPIVFGAEELGSLAGADVQMDIASVEEPQHMPANEAAYI